MKRKLPPFAKKFQPVHLGGDNNLAVINFGWTDKQAGLVVIPPEHSPFKFNWAFLRGCFVICRGDASLETREDLADILLEIGAISVRFILPAKWHEWHGATQWGSDHECYN